jgi:curved DNA-binding protein
MRRAPQVILQVSLPPADSDAARTLYKKMQDQLGFNPRATMGVS